MRFICYSIEKYYIPGDPEKGVKDLGGVFAPPPGWAPKNPPGEAMGGGEAGEEGPPLDVLGGLIRFSFCRLLKKYGIEQKDLSE